MLSTEGFCEGESTDVSPGSTLNKCSSRCTPTTVTDSENETTMILDEDKEDVMKKSGMTTTAKRRTSFRRTKDQKLLLKDSKIIEVPSIVRTDSKDDGMDCNFVSEDEEQDMRTNNQKNREEPIYVNARNETNEKNQQRTKLSRTEDDYSNNNNVYVANNLFFSSPELYLNIHRSYYFSSSFLLFFFLFFYRSFVSLSNDSFFL